MYKYICAAAANFSSESMAKDHRNINAQQTPLFIWRCLTVLQ